MRKLATLAGGFTVALLITGISWAALPGPAVTSRTSDDQASSNTLAGQATSTTVDDEGTGTPSTRVDDDSTATTLPDGDDDRTSTTVADGDDDRTSTTIEDRDDDRTSTTVPDDKAGTPADGRRTFDLGGHGSITVEWRNGGLVLIDVNAAAGCRFEIEEASADKIEVLLDCSDGSHHFEVEVEDGELRLQAGD
jgi:hypothetical protein